MRNILYIIYFLYAAGFSSHALGEESHPYTFGVQVHHGTWVERPIYEVGPTLEALQQLGFSSFRDDVGWAYFEDGRPLALTRRLGALARVLNGTKGASRPLLILTNGTPDFNNGALPTTESARAGFADFAERAMGEIAPYDPIVEIWNEWNLGTGTRSKRPGNPEDYVQLVKATYPRLKAAFPGSTFLVGALATDLDPIPFLKREWVWLGRAIELGLLDNGDGLSVHLYNVCRPRHERRPSEQIRRMEALVELLDAAKPGANYPFYVTEVGWPEMMKGCGFTEDEQISFSGQFLLWATKFPSLKGVWLYELKDSGVDPDNLEHHFGLLDFHYRPKPYFCGVSEARTILDGARFVDERVGPGAQVALSFDRSGDAVSAIWLAIAGDPVPFTVPDGAKARFLCETATFKEGEQVLLRERPLIVSSGFAAFFAPMPTKAEADD